MEAARVLALRGHAVTLFEAGSRLGGQILLAALGGWRKDMIGIAEWLAGEIDELAVDVRLDTYATGEGVAALAPDVVIVATGGIPAMELPNGGGDLVTSAWDVLSGHAHATGRVLIYDAVGGHAALSLADRLSGSVDALTFVTLDRHVGRAIGVQSVPVYLRNLTRAGATVAPDRSLQSVMAEGNRYVAQVRHAYTRELEAMDADIVIADLGLEPLTEVFDDLVDRSRNLGEVDFEALTALRPQPLTANPDADYAIYRIGDALTPRDIHAAILDANRLCRAI